MTLHLKSLVQVTEYYSIPRDYMAHGKDRKHYIASFANEKSANSSIQA